MRQATRKPTTSENILLYEYLEPLDSKISESAELPYAYHNSAGVLINSSCKLTTEMAFHLAKVSDATVDFRLDLQAVVDPWEVENNMCIQEESRRVETATECLTCCGERVEKVTQSNSPIMDVSP